MSEEKKKKKNRFKMEEMIVKGTKEARTNKKKK